MSTQAVWPKQNVYGQAQAGTFLNSIIRFALRAEPDCRMASARICKKELFTGLFPLLRATAD
jgi:hypothetical protein